MDENRQRRAHGKDVEMTEEKGPDDGDGPDEVGNPDDGKELFIKAVAVAPRAEGNHIEQKEKLCE